MKNQEKSTSAKTCDYVEQKECGPFKPARQKLELKNLCFWRENLVFSMQSLCRGSRRILSSDETMCAC